MQRANIFISLMRKINLVLQKYDKSLVPPTPSHRRRYIRYGRSNCIGMIVYDVHNFLL